MEDERVPPAQPNGPVHWSSVLPEDAERAWADLRAWVEQLVDRYALDARTVPPCWFRHNAHVEALVALRDAERACFGPGAPVTGGVDWLRTLWEIEHRLVEWSARTQCSVHEHRPDPERAWTTDELVWDAVVAADLFTREQQSTQAELADL